MPAVTTRIWRCGDREIRCGERTLLMGIVNVTPDSFSDGGAFLGADDAVRHALALAADGADILDVGGESTRPGADPVSAAEELDRILPVVEGVLAASPEAVISVDTRKAEVASAALAAGAAIVNDVTAGGDPEMFAMVSGAGAGMVLMHMLGDPKTMQENPSYADVVAEVRDFLGGRAAAAVDAGIGRDRLCVDPGIGFGKGLEHNLELLRHLDVIADLGLPVLVGPSRKRFIGVLTGSDDPAGRLEGTAAAVAWCASAGADIVRVHDVRAMAAVVRVADAIAREVP
jgi:dihydropteroate synthase